MDCAIVATAVEEGEDLLTEDSSILAVREALVNR